MFDVERDDPVPIYAQLERAIRAAIVAGRLSAGDRLPTVRQLAVELRVNANTVAKVYSELEGAGVLTTQRGVGTFVREQLEPDDGNFGPGGREQLLRLIADRLLADAHAAGLTIEECIQHLESRRAKER
jgi:GntR family transcriptional regulator